MKVAVLGSGMVGRAIAGKVDALGHDVVLGTRDVGDLLARGEGSAGDDTTFADWSNKYASVSLGTFAEAAAHGEVVFNATSGGGALAALALAGSENLAGKIVIDISNPLDFSKGMPPSLTVCNTDSLGERIQAAFPESRVVKALNTVNAALMVEPRRLADAEHEVFVSGNDEVAKATVSELLQNWFGWRHVIDLGDITTARGTEMYLALWVRLMGALGTPAFNLRIVR